MKRGGVHYGFAAWARANVDPSTPAEVTRYFEDRGVSYSKEFWRKLLNGDLRSVKLETWLRICDATGQRLSFFIDYQPTGRPPEPRKRPAQRKPKRPAAPALPPPPDPHRFFKAVST